MNISGSNRRRDRGTLGGLLRICNYIFNFAERRKCWENLNFLTRIFQGECKTF